MIGSYVKGVVLDTINNKRVHLWVSYVTNVAARTISPRCVVLNQTALWHTTDEDNQVSTDMFIDAIQKSQNPREWQIILPLNNQRMKFEIDTGAQCNVIPKQNYFQISKAPLQNPLLTTWHLVAVD